MKSRVISVFDESLWLRNGALSCLEFAPRDYIKFNINLLVGRICEFRGIEIALMRDYRHLMFNKSFIASIYLEINMELKH